MEPEKLNSSPADDSAFDEWLRTGVRPPEMADNGFSRAVVQRLPAPRMARSTSRVLVCLVAMALGLALMLGSVIRTPAAAFDMGTVDSQLQQALAALGTPGVGGAIAVALLSLAYVFRPELRRWRMRVVGI